MSILSVDNISPIGSGTSVTVNSAATLVLTNANSTGVITATSFVGSGANLTGVLSNIVEDTSPQLGGTLDTNNQDITFNGAQNISWDSSAADLIFNDYAKINLGTDKDFKMYQAGNNTILQSDNTSGGVYLQGALIQIGSETGEVGVKFVKDGAVELYHNNSKKFETTSYGSLVTGRLNTTGNISMPDNAQIHLGDSIDLALYHDGSDSFIKDTGTGALKVCSNLFRVNNAANTEAMIKAEENAGVTLSYDASTKFETTNTGATITGNLAFPSGNGIDFSATADGGTSGQYELLDDYEEGNWTPTVESGSGAFYVYSAKYTKIGRQVGIQFYMQLNNGAGNGNGVSIGGLPFAVRSNGWTCSKVSTGYNNSGVHCRAKAGTSAIDIKGPADQSVTFSNINGTWILSSFVYFTDS